MKTVILFIIKNWKAILISLLVIALVYNCEQKKVYKQTADRQTENVRQANAFDSLKFKTQNLTSKELKELLEYRDKELLKQLNQDKIKVQKIEKIINNEYFYRDTIQNNINLDSILKAVYSKVPKEQVVLDTLNCIKVKGRILFDGKSLSLQIDSKEVKNKSSLIVYQERKQWKLLGIKTRIFGKRQLTSKTYNECGDSKTELIQITKK